MSQLKEKIARSHFTTSALEDAYKYDAWKESIAAIFDVEPTVNTPKQPFDSEIESYMLGSILATRCRSSVQAFHRNKNTIARDGMDHILVQLYNTGGNNIITADDVINVRAGDIQVFDMAQEVKRETFVEATANNTNTPQYDNFSLIIARDSLEALVPMVRTMHLRVLKNGTPINAILKNYMISLFNNASAMTRTEGISIVRPTVELLATAISQTHEVITEGLHDIDNALLLSVRKFIDNNLHDLKLGPATILAHIGISRSALFRVCKPYGGVMTLIRDRRLLMARRMLSQPSTAHSVKMIAYKLGFTTPSNFARTYKQHFGFSPSDTRDLFMSKVGTNSIQDLENLNVGDRKWEYWVANMVV